MQTGMQAVDALKQAWPQIVAQSRAVLASELHYQAIIHHCLRMYGDVPHEQIGMNVKIWIPGAEIARIPCGGC